jgi:hypothetical protein
LRDKTRKPGRPKLQPTVIDRVNLTLAEPPDEARHWSGRAMGGGQRDLAVLDAAHLAGARPCSRTEYAQFKLSQYVAFAAKLRDSVGLYLDRQHTA